MIHFSRNSSTSAKLATMVLLFLISFSLYGLYCFNTVSEVKINGPFYHRIVQSKDVIADILPPPEYLIETYLTAFQMVDDKEGKQLPAFIEKTKKLRSDYLARHAFWEADLPEDKLKSALIRDSYAPAMRMLDSIEKTFIPALQAGDWAKAEALLHGTIQKDYTDHRSKIDEVVALAIKRNQDDEARAAVAVQSRTFGQIALGFCLFVLLSMLSWYMVNQIEASINQALYPKTDGAGEIETVIRPAETTNNPPPKKPEKKSA